jgi:predicted CoA-binding protein
MRYLQNEGYKVYPVNPDAVGQEIHGEKVYASLSDLPEKVDMVDIFRLPWKVPPVVDEAIALGVPYIWMQLKVINEEYAAKAEAAGAIVVMDRCPAIELPRLQNAA